MSLSSPPPPPPPPHPGKRLLSGGVHLHPVPGVPPLIGGLPGHEGGAGLSTPGLPEHAGRRGGRQDRRPAGGVLSAAPAGRQQEDQQQLIFFSCCSSLTENQIGISLKEKEKLKS